MWGKEESPLRKWIAHDHTVRELWEKIVNRLPTKRQELCAIVLRNIWPRHNTFIFKNQFTCPKQVLIQQRGRAKLQLGDGQNPMALK